MWNVTKTNHLLQELYFILWHSHDSLQSSSSRLVNYFFYFFSSSGKNPAHDAERSKTSHLKNHTYGLSKLCKSLRFENETTLEPWKWNSLHLHEIMAINLFIFLWVKYGRGGGWNNLHCRCVRSSQEVLYSPSPSLSCSCCFFWTIGSVTSCNPSTGVESQGSWSCRQPTARSSSSIPLGSPLQS